MSAERGEIRIRELNAKRIVRALAGVPLEGTRKERLMRCSLCDSATRSITGSDGLCDVCFAESHATCARCGDAWERVSLDEDDFCPVCCEERLTEQEAAYDFEQSQDERDTTIPQQE